MAEFVLAEGLVHVVNPVSGGEFTLCGDAFDLASDEKGYEWTPAKRKVVTCPMCGLIILTARGVRVDIAED